MSKTILKLMALVLTAAMVLGTVPPVFAADANSLTAQINAWDSAAHGGDGDLSAVDNLNGTITVTGNVYDAISPLELNIDAGVTVVWEAYYHGSHDSELIRLLGGGTFEVDGPGGINNNSEEGAAIRGIGSGDIHVKDGSVSGGEAISVVGSGSVSISNGHIYAASGSAVSTAGGDIILSGGFVMGNIDAGSGNATIVGEVDLYGHLTTGSLTVASSGTLIVFGEAIIEISDGYTLTNNGSIIIDGVFDNSGTVINNGTIFINAMFDNFGTVINNGVIYAQQLIWVWGSGTVTGDGIFEFILDQMDSEERIERFINGLAAVGNLRVSGTYSATEELLTLNIPEGRTVLWGADYTSDEAVVVYCAGTLIIENGKIKSSVGGGALRVTGIGTVIIGESGEVETSSEEGTGVVVTGTAALTVDGGTVTAIGHYAIQAYADATVTIISGTVIGGDVGVIYAADETLVTATGGTVADGGIVKSGDAIGYYTAGTLAMFRTDGDMSFALGVDLFCAHTWGEWEVTTPATATTAGVETRICQDCGETETQSIPATGGSDGDGGGSGGGSYIPIAPSYSFADGNRTYTQGSNEPLVKIIDKSFELFSGVSAGGRTLTRGRDYTAHSGSTVISLLPAYLETLSAGWHSITVRFRDGAAVTADFTIEAGTTTTPPDNVNNIPNTGAEIPFTDVSADDWFVNAVMWAYENGYMAGTSTDPMTFSPNMTLTRSMVVTVLYRYAGSPEVSNLANPFNDVPETWYTTAVKWAAANRIVSGYGNGKFAPESNITRQDLAVILNNYANFAGVDLPLTREYSIFADDADIRSYAREAVERFFRAMIISGKPGNLFDPQGDATRAEFASMINNFVEASK